MKQIVIALAVTASALVTAQLSTINSTRLEPRFYNDVPTSNFTFGNVWPGVFFDDVVSAPSGFANRHVWSVSNDGGSTSYLFQGTDNFTLTQKVKLSVVGSVNKEAGIIFINNGNGDHIFLVKTANNGEVAAFAGAFPFFSFTQNFNDRYVPGETATMSVTYFKDVDNINKVVYRYNNHFSGALVWGNVEGFLLPDTRIGGYLQVQNDPNNSANSGRADFSDITVSPAGRAFPESITVSLGRVTDGDKRSLHFSDGAALRICKFIIPNVTVAPITVQVDATSNYDTLSSLAFRMNSRMANAGLFGQTLDLFDWSTNSYSATDTLTTAINTTYQSNDVNATGSVGRYLGPNHELRARFRVRQTGPVSTVNWCGEFDEANFVIAP